MTLIVPSWLLWWYCVTTDTNSLVYFYTWQIDLILILIVTHAIVAPSTLQPSLDNDAVGAVKHGLDSHMATLDNLSGLRVEEEVTALLCDLTAN